MRRALILMSVLGVALFLALGVWQVQRLGWKVQLIAAVEARLAAAPIAPAEGLPEYTRVTVTGRYDGPDLLVKAVTEQGPGFWVMTPFQTEGLSLWINRGFVPEGVTPPAPSETQVTGLVRATQPGGGFLRKNDPPRWFSRDLAAMDAATGRRTADWFLDAQTGGPLPVPGLTVVAFPNHHLQYALTWFAMAALLAGAAWWNLGRRPHAH